MTNSTEAITEEVKSNGHWVHAVQNEIARVIVGQKYLIDRLLIGLLTNGHVLLEGVPGLAKTLAVKTLAACVHTKFQRLQFTPDLLPADIIGTMIYNPRDGEFRPKLGPIFSNLILADEINRAPAKVQSALLEAMQERRITISDQYLSAGGSVSGPRDSEPPGAGRHLSTAGSAAGSVHAEAERCLPIQGRGAKDPGSDGHLGARSLRANGRLRGGHHPLTGHRQSHLHR